LISPVTTVILRGVHQLDKSGRLDVLALEEENSVRPLDRLVGVVVRRAVDL
jgi:hypothetical protein